MTTITIKNVIAEPDKIRVVAEVNKDGVIEAREFHTDYGSDMTKAEILRALQEEVTISSKATQKVTDLQKLIGQSVTLP